MKTLKTKYGPSWLDFFNLEDFINLLDDYDDPYLYSLEGSDYDPVGTEYPNSTDYLDQ
jgi:hypothetical protein